MRTRLAACAVVVVVCLPPLARAEADERYTAVTFGMAVGTMGVGPIDGPTMGLHLQAARALGRVQVQAEYQLFDLTSGGKTYAESDSVGLMQRVGIAGRWAALRHDLASCCIHAGLYVEVGFGREWIQWDEGGRLGRDDLALGVGFDFVGGRRKKLGMSYMFRATLAENPIAAGDAPPTCGGPCDEATKAPRFDLGLLFVFGVTLSR